MRNSMSVFILDKNILSRNEITPLIDVCKSSSMCMGYQLRNAHYKLGEIMAESIFKSSNINNYAVLILMRAGLSFGTGIADKLEGIGASVSIIFINNDCVSEEDLTLIHNKEIIIVDAVINSGKSVFKLLTQLPENSCVQIASTVIPIASLHLFEELQLFTVRTSENVYQGAKVNKILKGKGPDTGDRLFNTY